MAATIIDGTATAAETRARVAEALKAAGSPEVTLATVLVGEDPPSQRYIRGKAKASQEVGITSRHTDLPTTSSQAQVEDVVGALAADATVHGILVQLPLPHRLDSDPVIRAIDPAKDVDGLHPASLGALAQGKPGFVPCTPKGCMRLLAEVGASLVGARAVVLGRSVLVGRPMSLLLANANATVTMCHSKTRDLANEVRRAEVVVAAVGKPELVRGDWIADGAIVIDVGINRTDEGKLLGDVAFTEAAQRARAITPVPGGVGPMTIACLLENTVEAAQRRGR